ncbi:hypothetical protein BDZ97DRAFT_1758559 [Flammula alnicola]|nr:hypothetical protein BDZ97DRAFT_1758559 [Flammula alnicola]
MPLRSFQETQDVMPANKGQKKCAGNAYRAGEQSGKKAKKVSFITGLISAAGSMPVPPRSANDVIVQPPALRESPALTGHASQLPPMTVTHPDPNSPLRHSYYHEKTYLY